MMLRIACVAVLALLAAQVHAQRKVPSNGFSYLIDKTPAWVDPAPKPAGVPWSGQSSTRYLLADTQVNLMSALPVRFTRFRVVAYDPTGLGDASQLQVQFNPAYQTLTLHEVGLTRDGKRVDKLAKLKIELLQRETRLEKSVYDGWITAFATIDDLRVNDIVDIAYSVRGANPVFGGRYSDQFTLHGSMPTDLRRVRVEHPARRSLHHKVNGLQIAPTVASKGAATVMEWAVGGLAPVKSEDRAAPWVVPYPELQISEYADWASVEAWAKEHYRVPGQASAEMLAVAERIRRESKSPAEMVARSLKFVQDDVRYFAVATGVSSHKPHPPNDTLARRYGDCKDKTVLTIALLERLGIRARPALVSIARQRQVAEWQPTPLAFDHVIAEVTLDGKTYWLDATRTHQRGVLDTLGFHPYGWALVVGAERRALTAVEAPAEYQSDMMVKESFSVAKFGAPANLVVTSRYSGEQAERMRAFLASKDSKVFALDLEDSMKRRYPSLRRLREPEIADEGDRNQLSINEYYEVSDLFTYERGRVSTELYASAMGSLLQVPSNVSRTLPLYLPHPAVVMHRFEYDLPLELRMGTSQPFSMSAPQFAFSYRSSQQGKRFVFEYEMRVLRDQVSPAEMTDFLDRAAKSRVYLSRQLRFPSFDGERLQKDYTLAGPAENRRVAKEPEWMRRHLMDSLATRMTVEAAIASGHLAGSFLAEAWVELAVAKSQSGDREGALAALEKSIAENPKLARAYETRAEILGYQGKFDAALGEMKRAAAIKEDPRSAYSLAQIHYYLGQYKEAYDLLAADAVRTAGPMQSFRLLWLYMAAKRAGLDPVQALRSNGYRGERPDWPSPALAYLAGDLPEDKMLASARQDPREAAPRLCEAWFFIAQKRLLSGDVSGARTAFEQALATQIKPYLEYIYSEIELTRLK